jgi:hypothetical protein
VQDAPSVNENLTQSRKGAKEKTKTGIAAKNAGIAKKRNSRKKAQETQKSRLPLEPF